MVSRRERARMAKDKRNKRIFSTIMILLMVVSVGSVFLYYGSGAQGSIKETHGDTDYEFELNQDAQGNYFYEVSYDNTQFQAFFPPTQLRTFGIDEGSQQFLLFNPSLTLTFDPHTENAQILEYIRFDVKNNAPSSKFLQDAITREHESYSLPVVSCDNATTPVVLLQDGNITSFTTTQTCLRITIGPQDYLRVRDMILYLLHGVEL